MTDSAPASSRKAPQALPTDRPIRVFRNTRPGIDARTCAQAAIATVLAHHGAGPFTHGAAGWNDADAIDVVREAFPPDMPLGLGTSAHRVREALRAHGLAAEWLHSGWQGGRLADALGRLVDHVRSGRPAPVLLDDGLIGGRPWAAHWAVAVGIHEGRVWLGNAGRIRALPLGSFLRAWRCRQLPWSHNHATVLATR